MTNDSSLVYIIILNWNGWKDTIECLESVFRLNYRNYVVIVCDNNSSDGSLEHIRAWAQGGLEVFLPLDNPLRHCSFPPILKPISCQKYDWNGVGGVGAENDGDFRLVLIQTGSNLGFAGGNNVGIHYALERNIFEYIWLLNNDTVIEPNTLNALVEKAGAYKSADYKIGIIGSKLLYYHNPDVIQGAGGIYNERFARTQNVGLFEEDLGQYDSENVIDKTDYPLGASMFVCNEFIKDVGFMCEDYFLYFEEMDWVLRGKKKSWQIGYCWQAKVYHKEGGTIGSSANGENRSELSDYFGLKNRILLTKNFFPHCLWSVRLGFILVLINRIRRRQFGRLGLVIRAFLGKPLRGN